MTSYDDIYSAFLSRIEDLELSRLSDSEQNERLLEYLKDAMTYIDVKADKLNHDLKSRDDDSESFSETLDNYEIQIIATFMTVSWYTSRLNSLENMTSAFGHKEEKWSSQKEMSNLIRANRQEAYNRARKLMRDYNIINNPYIGGY